ncbi:MAG: sigma-54-dependent Fis family transcriptional regulator, partial [Bacteroidales bacterium]|nr:sigma-54-dependent Fis family transcriptional regulator [Bacteroidales bacterium]
MNFEQIKQRFGIIGNSAAIDEAISLAVKVAVTDLSVLVTGESGVGKEFIPQIIHSSGPRKHQKYLTINCGAIPEGTIDSELFGHEKGAFTGAVEARNGYFAEADGGTLFLDEVAELPLSTQVRLLRVLQTGEYIKVGSAKVQKTNVRVVAATNVNLKNAIASGKFREDLYYRLSTVNIVLPPLRERPEDISLLFRRFAVDFADRYAMPPVRLTADAENMLRSYRWPGNVRELKSTAERISILETERSINSAILGKYIADNDLGNLPSITGAPSDYMTDRDIIFKMMVQLKSEITELSEKVRRLEGRGGPSEDFASDSRTVASQPHLLEAPAEASQTQVSSVNRGGYEEVEEVEVVEVAPAGTASDQHPVSVQQ